MDRKRPIVSVFSSVANNNAPVFYATLNPRLNIIAWYINEFNAMAKIVCFCQGEGVCDNQNFS